jgi:TetR/AcrR family transcriptional regulator, mexJK operon transcriptional repressor
MTTAALQIRRGRKFAQVLDGAREVFLRDGFEGASVDDIAREAGVSKATLYSYFPDKRLLFMEVAKAECRRQADEAMALIDDSAPVAEVLHMAATRITGFMLSEFGQRVYRICVAESDRFPGLGREFYDSGPQVVRDRLAEYLRGAVARGDLVVEDVPLAADQFAQLCKADLHDRLIFGIDIRGLPQNVERVVQGAVAMFLARYGAGPAKAPR